MGVPFPSAPRRVEIMIFFLPQIDGGKIDTLQGTTVTSLKLTVKAPENGWLEYYIVSFLGAKGLFSGAFAVSFRECI